MEKEKENKQGNKVEPCNWLRFSEYTNVFVCLCHEGTVNDIRECTLTADCKYRIIADETEVIEKEE